MKSYQLQIGRLIFKDKVENNGEKGEKAVPWKKAHYCTVWVKGVKGLSLEYTVLVYNIDMPTHLKMRGYRVWFGYRDTGFNPVKY